MIVVDATVLADRIAGLESLRASAVALAESDPIWISSTLWRYEFGNVLWKKIRLEGLVREVSVRGLEDAEALLERTVGDLDWSAILELALDREISFYDASYVWLGLENRCKVYSRDGALGRKVPEVVCGMPEG